MKKNVNCKRIWCFLQFSWFTGLHFVWTNQKFRKAKLLAGATLLGLTVNSCSLFEPEATCYKPMPGAEYLDLHMDSLQYADSVLNKKDTLKELLPNPLNNGKK